MHPERTWVFPTLVVVVLAAVAVIFLIAGRFQQELIYNAAGSVAVFALCRHALLRRPRERAGWLWLLAGTTSFAAGDVLYFHHQELFGVVAGFPSAADYCYLGALPLIATGLMSFIRRRKGGLTTAIDAAIFATTAGVLVWVFLVDPVADQSALPSVARVFSVAYPVGAVLLIAMTGWLALAPGGRRGPFRWLILAYALNFGASAIYSRQSIDGTYLAGTWVDLGWIFSYICVAAAVLARPSGTEGDQEQRLVSPVGRRMSVLAATGLLGPGIVLFARARGIHVDASELTLGCLLLFLFALGRMGLLASALDSQRSLLDERSEELANVVTSLTEAQSDRARLLDDVMKAGDSERAALARELHDGPIQQLSALNFETDLALMALAEGELDETAAAIRSLQEGVAGQISVLRDLMSGLRPPALDEHGLVDAVRDQVRAFSGRTRIETTFSSDLDARLEPAFETILYRAIQESLINIEKHAHASSVEVTLTSSSSEISLSVSDDGIGFDASDPHILYRQGHLGLVSIRERVETVGGVLIIRGRASGGTTMQVTIPMLTCKAQDV